MALDQDVNSSRVMRRRSVVAKAEHINLEESSHTWPYSVKLDFIRSKKLSLFITIYLRDFPLFERKPLGRVYNSSYIIIALAGNTFKAFSQRAIV